jgi:putative multiple sugar transport system substrate-binding protein
VYKDTRALAATTVDMVVAVLDGGKPEVNDEETYDNGVKVVPAYLLEPVSVDVNNYQEVVVDSGYIDASELA